MREILARLVAIPSVSGQEQEIAEYLAERSQYSGSTVTMLGDNVAIHIPGTDSTKAFLLNGHIDTVPPTEQWTKDPFMLTPDSDDEDKLIGLGASDMKAGAAIMVDVADEAAKQTPPCDLWLLYSSREETDSSGSVQVADWLSSEVQGRYRTIGGLILEPTDAAFVGVGHRGDTLWQVLARGPGGHASKNFAGELPPIEKVAGLIARLPELRERWLAYGDMVLGAPSINPTIIGGGSTANVVPTEASTTLNLRVTPQLLPNLPKEKSRLEDIHGLEISQAWQPTPTLVQPTEIIYRAAKAAMPNVPFAAFPGATDQFAFHNHNMPMLIFGPGKVAAMHQPDEWVRYSAMVKARAMVDLVLRHY